MLDEHRRFGGGALLGQVEFGTRGRGDRTRKERESSYMADSREISGAAAQQLQAYWQAPQQPFTVPLDPARGSWSRNPRRAGDSDSGANDNRPRRSSGAVV